MPIINICGLDDNSDPFYRYKRQEIIIQNQKTKIAIINLDQVAQGLSRDPKTIIVYFKKKLGISFVFKKEQYITPKIVTKDDLEQSLKEYTEDFVLCKGCNYPETDLLVNENSDLYSKCKCCSNVHIYKTNQIVDSIIKIMSKNIDNTSKKSKRRKKNNYTSDDKED